MNHCFYHHNCMDGWAAAAVVFNYGNVPKEGFHSSKYDDVVDMNSIEEGCEVYIVDFSFPMKIMKEISAKANVIWIDHHVTAIKNAEEENYNPQGLRDVNFSGAELTWKWWVNNPGTEFTRKWWMNDPVPETLELLGKYDSWRFTKEEKKRVMDYRFGLEAYDLNFNNPIWPDKIFSDDPQFKQEVLVGGNAINIFKEKRNIGYCEDFAFETVLKVNEKKYTAIAMTTPDKSSMTFDSIYTPEKYDLMIRITRRKDHKWDISLYTRKEGINVGEIAKHFGGGGHAGASGFICDKLPFEI